MTVPMLSSENLMKLLKQNGWKVVSNDFFDEYGELHSPFNLSPNTPLPQWLEFANP
jgi:hypothetical protein